VTAHHQIRHRQGQVDSVPQSISSNLRPSSTSPTVTAFARTRRDAMTTRNQILIARMNSQPFVADVLDNPLSDQEVRQLRQAPGRERQAMLSGLGLGDLLDLAALRQLNPSALKFRITSRPRSSLANATFAIAARPFSALRAAPSAPTARSPSGSPAHDPHHPAALIIIDLRYRSRSVTGSVCGIGHCRKAPGIGSRPSFPAHALSRRRSRRR